jgi:hypothetical protein
MHSYADTYNPLLSTNINHANIMLIIQTTPLSNIKVFLNQIVIRKLCLIMKICVQDNFTTLQLTLWNN